MNDSDPWRPHLGALAGREAGLAEVTSGHISNPMSQACASMIPLATVADFLWNPAAYNPERSLNEAVVGQYGRAALRLLDLFLKTYRGDSWDDSLFTQLFYARQKPLDIPAMEQRLKELARALQVTRNRGGFQKLAAELAPFLTRTRERLSDGKLALREDYCLIEVLRLASPLTLDGDFSKWSSHRIYALDPEAQILRGAKHWEGPEDFAARAPFAWNENYLYVGVDVTDKELYQPAVGRGIENGDAFSLTVHTAFRKNYFATESTGDEYRDLCQSWRLLRGRAQRLFR